MSVMFWWGHRFFSFSSFTPSAFFSSNYFLFPSCIHIASCLVYGFFSCVFILAMEKSTSVHLGIPLLSTHVSPVCVFLASGGPLPHVGNQHLPHVGNQVRCFPMCSLASGRRGNFENFLNTSRPSCFPSPPELLKY